MVGSSFNSPAESNYAPIEGECLGVASALHKTRYYTQGCDKLVIGTDHKTLLGVLNDRSLDSLDNLRFIRLKEKTLGWSFKIIHIPGKKLCGPDALSREPNWGEDSQEYAEGQFVCKGAAGQSQRDESLVAAEEHTRQGHQAFSGQGSLWKGAQRLLAEAGVLPYW